MADEWFYQQGDFEVGPLRPKELLDYVRKGVIRKHTPIRKGDSNWTPADQVGGLFEAARKPTRVFFCPQCDKEIEQPPSYCPSCERHVDRAPSRLQEHHLPSDDDTSLGDRLTGGAWSNWLARLKKN